MEPAAPGTEDEIETPILSANLNKKENEQERLLSLKARLLNGQYNNVFELSFQNGAEQWYCNLCTCPIMGRVYHHEIGKRHTNNMQHAAGSWKKKNPNMEHSMQLAPGQPIPPGFEGVVEKIAQIQDRLDSFTVGPLTGLEYLFELQEYDRDREPAYLCLLCDKRGDPRTVIAHLASYNHISQYLQRHFISCFRALSPYITKQYKRNWQATMHKIAEAIETKFGRLKPHVVDREIFDKQRNHYANLVALGPHFNEKPNLTFEELIDKEQIIKLVSDQVHTVKAEDVEVVEARKSGTEQKAKHSPSPPVVARPKKPKPSSSKSWRHRSLSSVSSISSSDLSDMETKQSSKAPQKKLRRVSPVRDKSCYQRREARPASPYHRRSIMPWQREDYIRSRRDSSLDYNKEKTDKLDEYKKLSNAIENDMDRILKQHEKNPEKHPQYNEEWKKFWNTRYKELQAEGKDVTSYDFKPEWIEFWNKKMIEIHTNEVRVKKDALRKRLGLPEEPSPVSFRITGKRRPPAREDSKPAPIASTPDCDPDVILIEDKDEDSIISKRSHSPWESESVSRVATRRSRNRSRERSREARRSSRERRRARLSRDRSRDRSRERSRFSRDRSRDRSRERRMSRGRSRDRGRISRDRSRECSHRDRSRSRTPEKRRIREPEFSRDKVYYRESTYKALEFPEYIKPPHIMRDVTRHPVHSPPPPMAYSSSMPLEKEIVFDENEEVNIISVLRLLTALEEKLGSLGPKVIDLLAQALAMEKKEANSSETLIDNEINCVLFETVKEKLKGQLLAELVGYNQEKAFKHAIKNIASLIHFAGERKKNDPQKPKVDPITVAGVGTVDKAAIAKQIATALINQGKTDVTQAELEQLINAVVGMAEASKNSEKPMTTASFLEHMSAKKEVENKSKPPEGSLVSVLKAPEPEPTNSKNSMEDLSDTDLQTLLQNFKDLCNDEQHSLISYLKKLEAKEPERVERLRKFVSLDPGNSKESEKKEKVEPEPELEVETEPEPEVGRSSPFSSRIAGQNPTEEENKDEIKVKVKHEKPLKVFDSEDEDYSYEDVFKVAKQNVTEKEENDKKIAATTSKSDDFDLSMAKSLIANIMGQFKTSTKEEPSQNLPAIENLGNIKNPLDMLPSNVMDAINNVNQSFKLNSNDFNMRTSPPREIGLNLNIGPSRPSLNLLPRNPSLALNRPPNRPLNRPLNQDSNAIFPNQNFPQNFSNPSQSHANFGQQGPRPGGRVGNNFPLNSSYPEQEQFRNSNNQQQQQFREQPFNNFQQNRPNNRPRPNQFDNNYGQGW